MRRPLTALATLALTLCAAVAGCSESGWMHGAGAGNDGFQPLFNGKNLDGWYVFLDRSGKNNDAEKLFQVADGMIHIGNVPESTATQEVGYIATEKSYGNFHLRLQYKWGTKKWAPRANELRDSGVHYLFNGPDKVWENALECQIQEGDTGDVYNLNGTYVLQTTVKDPSARPMTFALNGTPTQLVGNRLVKGELADTLTGWNTVEVIVKGNNSTHIVNGKVVAQLNNIMSKDGKPVTEGRIALQTEAAEMWYRNVEIKLLK